MPCTTAKKAAHITLSIVQTYQLAELELELGSAVIELKHCQLIRKVALLDDILQGAEEHTIGEMEFAFLGGDEDILHEAKRMVAKGVLLTKDSNESEDKIKEVALTRLDVSLKEDIELCRKLE